MGVKYVCRHCGYVIWEFKHVGQDYYGIPTPSEIMLVTGGFCPRCRHELSIPSIEDITIRAVKRRYAFSELERFVNESMRGGILDFRVRNADFMTAQEA